MNAEQLVERRVRLFPTAHISSSREAELRAAAALLAMLRAVSEFGRQVVRAAKGPKGRLESYTEVPFGSGLGPHAKTLRPDGLLVVTRGKTRWQALVEVKVGDGLLDQQQFDDYHRLAGAEGIDAVITVSNQAAQANGHPPLTVDGRRLKRCRVVHFSWERLLSEARLLSRREGVDDSDQQWMLEEWIRYVADGKSRIIEAPHLGEHWAKVLKAARDGHLATLGPEMTSVAEHWAGFLRKTSLRLRAKLGVDVKPKLSRAEKASSQLLVQNIQRTAVDQGRLDGVFRVPDAVGDISLDVRLPARVVCYGVTVQAPDEGRAKTRVNWLLRQLRSARNASELVVKVRWDRARLTTQARLSEAAAAIEHLLQDAHGNSIPKECMPRSFELERASGFSKGRGKSSAPVLEGLAAGLESFYTDVVQVLRPHVPSAPKLETPRVRVETPAQESSVAERDARVPESMEDPGTAASARFRDCE